MAEENAQHKDEFALDQLIDRYLEGTLPPKESQAFEVRMDSEPKLKQRVDI